MCSPCFSLHLAGGAALAVALLGVATGTVRAQSNGAVAYALPSIGSAAAQTLAYSTPERIKSAKPKILATTRAFTPSASVAPPAGPTVVVPGAPPSAAYDPSLAGQLYVPDNQGAPSPFSVGSTGPRYPYTIARLYPCAGSLSVASQQLQQCPSLLS
jgi:hypothetical protein